MKPKEKPNEALSFVRKMMALKAAGIAIAKPSLDDSQNLLTLNERIPKMLGIINAAKKSTQMVYFIMYDIEDNKVRRQVSRFLEKKGFLRVQRSIFLAKSERVAYEEIHNTLREVNELYTNYDSIIIIPVSNDEMRSMKLIGKNVDMMAYHERPNSMIF